MPSISYKLSIIWSTFIGFLCRIKRRIFNYHLFIRVRQLRTEDGTTLVLVGEDELQELRTDAAIGKRFYHKCEQVFGDILYSGNDEDLPLSGEHHAETLVDQAAGILKEIPEIIEGYQDSSQSRDGLHLINGIRCFIERKNRELIHLQHTCKHPDGFKPHSDYCLFNEQICHICGKVELQ